jgi:hypothetical protein
MAKRFIFDARVNTTITVIADNQAEGEVKANAILDRLRLTDADTEQEFATDTEDGIDLLDEEDLSDEETTNESDET